MQKQQQQQLSLKATSVHDYSELSEIEKTLLQERSTILIVRITPVALKDPQELAKFANQLYLIATRNNYSVFRLGEERIIVIPSCINVEK
ncbi:MAG: hypothetical protein JO327_07375 [Nitrososphaeraceae archaeon]|nr:hypothetical protein [Nitrososphaeraceae archaeon]